MKKLILSLMLIFAYASAQSPTCPCSMFSNPTQGPLVDSLSIEVGVVFSSSVAGQITAIRFYKEPANTGTHIGSIWTTTGTLLARTQFQSESASGWQQQSLNSPLTINAGTKYVVSVHSDTTVTAGDINFFISPYSKQPFTVPTGGGMTIHSTTPTFPKFNSSVNYYVDVVLTTGTGSPTPSPSPTPTPTPSPSPSPTPTPSPTPIPTPVPTPTPTPTPQHSVDIGWNACAQTVVYFNVYRSDVSGGPYTLIQGQVPNSPWADTSVVSGKTYFYTVTSVVCQSESAPSQEIQVVVP